MPKGAKRGGSSRAKCSSSSAAATPLGGDYAGDVRTMGNVLELTRDISDRFRRNDVRLGAVQRELVAIQLTEEPPASAGPSSLPTLHAQGERLLALLAQLKQEVTVSGERMNAIKSTLSVLLQLDEGAAAGPPSLLQLELRLGNASQDGHQQARLRRRAAALSLVPPQPDEAAPAAGGAGPALLPAAGSDGTLARLERRKAEQLERDALDGALSAPAPSSGGGARAGGGGPARPPAEQALDVLLDAVKAMVLRRRPPVDEQVATLWETTRRLAAISKDYADKIKFMRSNVVNFAQIEESYPAGPAAIPGPAAADAAAADAAAADAAAADLEPAADGAAAAAWPGSPADTEMVEASAQRATAPPPPPPPPPASRPPDATAPAAASPHAVTAADLTSLSELLAAAKQPSTRLPAGAEPATAADAGGGGGGGVTMQESVVSQTLQRCQDALDEVFRLTTDLAARARALRQTVSVFLEFDAGTGTDAGADASAEAVPAAAAGLDDGLDEDDDDALYPSEAECCALCVSRCGEAGVRACEVDVAACDGFGCWVCEAEAGAVAAPRRTLLAAPRHHANHAASAAAAEAELRAEAEAAEEVERATGPPPAAVDMAAAHAAAASLLELAVEEGTMPAESFKNVRDKSLSQLLAGLEWPARMAYSNVATLWKLVKGLNHVLSQSPVAEPQRIPPRPLRFAREAAVWGRVPSPGTGYLGGDPDSIGRHEDAPAPSPPGEADEAQASLLQEAEAAAEELASFLQADDGGDGGQVSASDAEATQLNRLVTSLRKADELTLRTIQLLRYIGPQLRGDIPAYNSSMFYESPPPPPAPPSPPPPMPTSCDAFAGTADGAFQTIYINQKPVIVRCFFDGKASIDTFEVSGGSTTRRNTDANSCPSGMDIWVPRTQTILSKVFAAYGNKARAVGVYGGANGCGSCTSKAMNSGTAQASHWHSVGREGGGGDAPWFLRSVPYGEPNGDYTSGCWLYVHGSTDGNGALFNDWWCKYGFTDYVCSTNQWSGGTAATAAARATLLGAPVPPPPPAPPPLPAPRSPAPLAPPPPPPPTKEVEDREVANEVAAEKEEAAARMRPRRRRPSGRRPTRRRRRA